MKKFMFSLMAVAAMTACSKDPQNFVESNQTPEEGGAAEQVLLTTNVKASVVPKSAGGVDAWDGAQHLHIYGVKRQSSVNPNYANQSDVLIDDVVAVSPVEGAADNSIGVFKENRWDLLQARNGELVNPGELFYYEGNNAYDFFAFYIDDIEGQLVKEQAKVYVPIEINGGQDVMIAKADITSDSDKAFGEGLWPAGWDERYAYSAYAARRGVHPSLNFEHQLVRFRFYIESGSEFTTTGQPENLVVKGLSVTSQYKADLCVAGNERGLTNISDETKDLALCSLDPQTKALVPLVPYEVHDKNTVITDESNLIGESLMVFPGKDEYTITLHMRQYNNDETFPVTLKFSDVKDGLEGQTAFEAGYSYKVYINVVGIEDVELSAELEEWKDGGRVEIDSDLPPVPVE